MAWSEMSLNLPENSNSTQQQEVLDALPVLVFLERAGQIVFANAEARQMLGVAEAEWVQRPVEDVLWGLFPGTAEPQTSLTGSKRAEEILASWNQLWPSFVRVMPNDYRRVLETQQKMRETGLSPEEAEMAAFEQNSHDAARLGGK